MVCFTKLDYLKYTIIGSVCVFCLLYLFYDSYLLSGIGSLLGLYGVKLMKAYRIQKERRQMKQQFKECLHAISTSLQVGKSVENAFDMAYKDLSLLYKEETFIMVELKRILSQLALNTPIEAALYEFALRANDEDISNFVMIFMSSKKTGGNLKEVMQSTTTVIHDKLEFLDEMYVLVSGKRFEHVLMMALIPLFIIYLRWNAGDFIGLMYTTIEGRLVMTMSLLLYVFSCYLGHKIVSIEV